MAETAKTIDVMTEYPTRLQMSMLAPVRKMAALIKDGDKEAYVIGYVRGTARGVSFRNNPNSTDGSSAEALIGAFEGIPAYDDMAGFEENDKCSQRPRLASAICFLPSAAQTAVVKAILGDQYDKPADIKRGKRIDQLGVEVPLAVEIAIRKNSGGEGAGYEWVVRGLARVEAIDPIEAMRKLLGQGGGADMKRIVDNSDKAAAKSTAVAKADKKKPSKR